MDLCIFLFGAAFVMVVLPLFNAISEFVTLYTELIRSGVAVKIAEREIAIEKLKAEVGPSEVSAIGFAIGDDEEEFDEDDEDMENFKWKVGF